MGGETIEKTHGSPRSNSVVREVMRPRVVLNVGLYGATLVGVVVVGSVLGGWSPSPRLIAVQGMMPLVALGAVVLTICAVVMRNLVCGVAALVVALTASAMVVPHMSPDQVPSWVAGAPTFTVYSANLWGNANAASEAFAEAMVADADIVYFTEYNGDAEPQLVASGLLDRYDTVVRTRRSDGNLLLTRLEATDNGVIDLDGSRQPTMTVRVADREVVVAAVHLSAPFAVGSMKRWRLQRELLSEHLTNTPDAVIIGDLNSTAWNSVVRDLRSDGFTDAHMATGNVLERTWGRRVPGTEIHLRLLGIDRALSKGQVFPTEISSSLVPGSDHTAINATLAVRPVG